jgi:hypothetical protein
VRDTYDAHDTYAEAAEENREATYVAARDAFRAAACTDLAARAVWATASATYQEGTA